MRITLGTDDEQLIRSVVVAPHRNDVAHTRQTEETRMWNKKKDTWQMVHFHRSDSKITY